MPFASFVRWLLCALAAIHLAHAAEQAAVPQATSLVVDEAGALTETERELLLGRLRSFERAERAQIAVLISSGTGNETLAEYALRVAESWQLGRASRDDGLLIVVVPSPAGARIEVGYGLEGAIPDARASRWIDELLPFVREKAIAKGLDHVLDRIDAVLPAGSAAAPSQDVQYLFPDHPEWRAPFALTIFSLFALVPLFFGAWGGIASAPLLTAFLGGAAWILWGFGPATYAIAATAFVLPLLWGLNHVDGFDLPRWLEYAKAFGNLMGVMMFFAIISLFVCTGLHAAGEPVWPGFMFSGLLSIGLAAALFPSASHYLGVVLRSAMHFVFVLVVVYVALGAFIPDPSRIAFATATFVTAAAAIGLYLDSREARGSVAAGGIRWSVWFFGAALLAALPFAILALFLAVGGEDLATQLKQAAAGGGTLAAMLALAARVGLIAAVKVGLGGRFGGGGAGRSD